MSEQSQEIGELVTALAEAQGEIVGALKDAVNPAFKRPGQSEGSRYADLASVMEAIRGPFSKRGLAYVQTTDIDGEGVTVVTTLAHKSGQWMRGRLRMMPRDASPQGIGSCLTYARRYALAAIAGVAQIDDDGNAASGKDTTKGTTVDPRGDNPPQDPTLVKQYVERFTKAMDNPDDIAAAGDVFKIHSELAGQQELYIAIGDAMGSKNRNALHKFVQIAKKRAA